MDTVMFLQVFVLSLILRTVECQNLAGLMATLNGGMDGMSNGFSLGGGNNGRNAGGGSGGCPYQPHPIKTNFVQIDNSRRMIKQCAQGTEYEHSSCACVNAVVTKSGPPPSGSNQRIEMLRNAMQQQMPQNTPGMEQMMSEFFRRLQGQQGGGASAPAPPPIPRAPGPPPQRRNPPQPWSHERQMNNQRNERRQRMQGRPIQIKTTTLAPPPAVFPTTSKPNPTRPRKRNGKGRSGRKKKGNKRRQQVAKLLVDARHMKAGPPYKPQPAINAPKQAPPSSKSVAGGKAVYVPIQKTDSLPPAILQIIQASQRKTKTTTTTTPAPPPEPINPFIMSMLPKQLQQFQQLQQPQQPQQSQQSQQQQRPQQQQYPQQPLQPPAQSDPNGGFALPNFPALKQAQNQGAQGQGPTPNQISALLAMLTGSNPADMKSVQPTTTTPVPTPPPVQNDPFASLLASLQQTGSGRKPSGQGPNAAMNSMFGGMGAGLGAAMGNGMGAGLGAGMGGGMGPGLGSSMGAGGFGGLGSGNAGMSNLLAALGGGGSGGGTGSSGLGSLGGLNLGALSLAGLSGSSAPGAPPPPDMTNLFNMQGRMAGPALLTGMGNVNHLLLHQLDRKGIIDMSDLTPAGLIAASNHFSRGGGIVG